MVKNEYRTVTTDQHPSSLARPTDSQPTPHVLLQTQLTEEAVAPAELQYPVQHGLGSAGVDSIHFTLLEKRFGHVSGQALNSNRAIFGGQNHRTAQLSEALWKDEVGSESCPDDCCNPPSGLYRSLGQKGQGGNAVTTTYQ